MERALNIRSTYTLNELLSAQYCIVLTHSVYQMISLSLPGLFEKAEYGQSGASQETEATQWVKQRKFKLRYEETHMVSQGRGRVLMEGEMWKGFRPCRGGMDSREVCLASPELVCSC